MEPKNPRFYLTQTLLRRREIFLPKWRKATAMAKERFRPNLIIEGEMQANVAINEEIQTRDVSFSFKMLNKKANTLISRF